MLTEVNRFPEAALPLEICKAHLRLGAGFADEGGQDGLVLCYLRSAILAIEARTGKALLAREFRWRRPCWRDPRGEALPVAPVRAVSSVTLYDRFGAPVPVAPERYRLEVGTHRARLCPTGWMLPEPPTGGAVEVVFEAGFGAEWTEVPADLAQAVFMLTAQYHENRHGGSGLPRSVAIPFDIMALIEPWRVIRTGAVGAR